MNDSGRKWVPGLGGGLEGSHVGRSPEKFRAWWGFEGKLRGNQTPLGPCLHGETTRRVARKIIQSRGWPRQLNCFLLGGGHILKHTHIRLFLESMGFDEAFRLQISLPFASDFVAFSNLCFFEDHVAVPIRPSESKKLVPTNWFGSRFVKL